MNEIFKHLHCSQTQAKIYLQLLELGPTLASIIAKRSKLKRVTVYSALEGLEQKGIVETYKKNDVNYYQACDPEVISNMLEARFDEEKMFFSRAGKQIKEMKRLKEKSDKHVIEVKGVISYYEGVEEVKNLQEENLNVASKTQYCIGISGYRALKNAGTWREYINARVKKGMKVYSIQEDNSFGKKYKGRDGDELRETRLVPADKISDHGELNIIGDRIILFTSEDQEAMGVKIVNKKIANILKKLFEMAWDNAGKVEGA